MIPTWIHPSLSDGNGSSLFCFLLRTLFSDVLYYKTQDILFYHLHKCNPCPQSRVVSLKRRSNCRNIFSDHQIRLSISDNCLLSDWLSILHNRNLTAFPMYPENFPWIYHAVQSCYALFSKQQPHQMDARNNRLHQAYMRVRYYHQRNLPRYW